MIDSVRLRVVAVGNHAAGYRGLIRITDDGDTWEWRCDHSHRSTSAARNCIRRMVRGTAAIADELSATFDLRWAADQRAIKRWQEAHPGNDLTWPDHADLVIWLMEQLDEVQREETTA